MSGRARVARGAEPSPLTRRRSLVDAEPVGATRAGAHAARRCLPSTDPDTRRPTVAGYTCIKKAWATALRKAGIANLRLHDLRHTFASYVQMGLGDLRATQVLLGHADPRMTQRYAHLSDERLRDAVRALNRLPGTGTRSGTGRASGAE